MQVAGKSHFLNIFIVAFSTLAFQILVTRILSVTLLYHFAFASISLAMLGLTIGAIKVFNNPDLFSEDRVDEHMAKHSLYFGLFALGATLLHLASYHIIALFLFFLLLIATFTQSGIVITLQLTSFNKQVNRLYACDLIGAALGCVFVILALRYLDPISAIIIVSLLLAYNAYRLLEKSQNRKLHRYTLASLTLLTLLALAQSISALQGSPLISLWHAKMRPLPDLVYERWNTHSHVTIFENEVLVSKPFGWGFGHEQNDPAPSQKMLNIDSDAGTVLTQFDGDLSKVSYLQNDVINLGYHVRDIDAVAVIGVGGGRDILSALYFGAENILGIEMNPAILHALRENFRDFTGNIAGREEVTLVEAEARSYLNQTANTFDLIQISLIDTWAATAGGALSLTENTLYTVDAWKDFLRKLNPNGMFTVSRWFRTDIYEHEYLRMLAIAHEAIRAEMPDANPRDHLLAARTDNIITLVVSRSPISAEDIQRLEKASKEQGYTVMITPHHSATQLSADIATGKLRGDEFHKLPLDVSPTTDDRPFFFHMVRFADAFSVNGSNDALADVLIDGKNNATAILLSITLIVIFWGGRLVFYPLYRLAKAGKPCPPLPHLSYFAMIGFGFMMIEIAQMQRLMIFLGHPVYGLAVVLFTLLFFSGLGSFTVKPEITGRRQLIIRPLMLVITLLIVGWITPEVSLYAKTQGIPMRIALSIALLAPVGFMLGMMFPLGVALARNHYGNFISWFWAVNGVFSVAASIVAIVISIAYGITFAYWVGVICYIGCLLIAITLKPKEETK